MNDPASAAADDTLLSNDGVLIGPVLGIHRHPASRTALWAVVGQERSSLLVPLAGAVTEPGLVRAAYPADRVLSSPSVVDPTRLRAADESRLNAHYGAPSPPSRDATAADGELSVVRSEERLDVRALEWRPYQRVRLRTVLRSREEKHVVRVHWEELVVENEPVSAVERLEVSAGLSRPNTADVEVVLHREEVTVSTRVVPYERVRATRSSLTEERQVTETLRKEHIDIEQEPVP
ncbi:MAG: YsnF/AvaK domain-containing protein, partial [Candidatus Dormibacteria bacterium]